MYKKVSSSYLIYAAIIIVTKQTFAPIIVQNVTVNWKIKCVPELRIKGMGKQKQVLFLCFVIKKL